MSTTGWIVIAVIVVLAFWIMTIYNGLIALRQRVNRLSPTSMCRPSSGTTWCQTWWRP